MEASQPPAPPPAEAPAAQPQPTTSPADKSARPKAPDVRADATMAEAARAVLGFHFDRLLDLVDDVRSGTNREAIHKMRVAARRQRAALDLFVGCFKPKALRPFQRALKTLAGHLGAVRDLDVALDKAHQYQVDLELTEAAAFEPLLLTWQTDRQAALTALVDHLESRAFRRFKKRFVDFLNTPGAGEPAPSADPAAPVHVPELLPSQLWEYYGAVRAYAPLLPDADVKTLHLLRLTGKRLRYALEFFSPALGSGLARPLKQVVALQDHLGELHDAAVSVAELNRFADSRHPRPPKATRAVVKGYAQHQQARLTDLCRTVNRPWRPIVSRAFRQSLALAVARL